MMNLKKVLVADVEAALREAGFDVPDDFSVVVNRNEEADRGDYASPVALALAKVVGKAPMEIAEAVASVMPEREYIAEVTVATPGFLNIRLSDAWLAKKVDDLLEQDVCADAEVGGGRLVNMEFISANPTGPLTLGNARTAFSADTLANVMECAGFQVTREYYINDAGNQIKRLGESVLRRILLTQGEKVEFPEDLYQGQYIEEIGADIVERWRENEGREFELADLKDDDLLAEVSRESMEMMLAAMKKVIHDDLKIHFDVWASERAVRKGGLIEQAVTALDKKGLLYEKDGARYLKTTEFGDEEDRVLVKKDGEYAYIAPDIGYHQDKFNREFDLLFTFLGADHQGHVPKLVAAMEALGNDVSKLHFPIGQWLALKRDGKAVKMSKRKGEVYSPVDLIGEIGYDAARFFMVQHNLNGHMELDLDLARERSERNPVYYVQYAYVRLQSILRKAKEQDIIKDVDGEVSQEKAVQLVDPTSFTLLKKMYQLAEIVEDVSTIYEPHRLAFYAHELARDIHTFYGSVSVLGEEDVDLQYGRIQLVKAARKVLGKTLDLLGVSKPDVM